MKLQLRCRGQYHTCLIDDEDYVIFKKLRCFIQYKKTSKLFYLVGYDYSKGCKFRKMKQFHRVITNCPSNLEVDHINHNSLDNRKQNLRIVNRFQNQQNKRGVLPNNKLGIRGVGWNSHNNKYAVRLQVNRKKIFAGYYDNIEDAAEVSFYTRKFLMPFSSNEQMKEV